MKIKLLNQMAGPEGNFAAGTIIDVPELQAVNLVTSGYAIYAGPIDDELSESEMEVATTEPEMENTARTKAIKRKRKL